MTAKTASALLVLLAFLGGATVPAHAQPPTDLTKLSLQELMALDVISVDVLGSHVHPAGQWMVGYELMFENMDGNRDGTSRINHDRVLEGFATSPTKMTMQMHMAMLMYAPSNDLTLMAMLPYVLKSMDHVTRDGARFTERTEGFGDLELRAFYTLFRVREVQHRLLLNAGVSVPTGSINEKDTGPERSMGRARLEYPMQLGSGTVDLLPGLTYLGQTANWAWGAEFVPTVRLGTNSNHYRLGNRYRLTAWGDRRVTDWFALSARLDGQRWDNIHGADPTLDPMDEPTKDPKLQGGDRIALLAGISFYVPRGPFQGQRLAIEVGAPTYQSLNGPQLQTDLLVRVGWQWAF